MAERLRAIVTEIKDLGYKIANLEIQYTEKISEIERNKVAYISAAIKELVKGQERVTLEELRERFSVLDVWNYENYGLDEKEASVISGKDIYYVARKMERNGEVRIVKSGSTLTLFKP